MLQMDGKSILLAAFQAKSKPSDWLSANCYLQYQVEFSVSEELLRIMEQAWTGPDDKVKVFNTVKYVQSIP